MRSLLIKAKNAKLRTKGIQRKDSSNALKDIPEISKLNTPERILLVEDLWDSISMEEADVPVLESHKAELDRRLRKHEPAPGSLLNLEDLKSRIEKRK